MTGLGLFFLSNSFLRFFSAFFVNVGCIYTKRMGKLDVCPSPLSLQPWRAIENISNSNIGRAVYSSSSNMIFASPPF